MERSARILSAIGWIILSKSSKRRLPVVSDSFMCDVLSRQINMIDSFILMDTGVRIVRVSSKCGSLPLPEKEKEIMSRHGFGPIFFS